jgi:hypothetical protein
MPAHRALFVLSFLPTLAAALLFASSSFADERQRPFGERGQIALGDIVTLRNGSSSFAYSAAVPFGPGLTTMAVAYDGVLGYVHYDYANAAGSPGGYRSELHSVWLAPSLDAFVGRNVSLGGTVAASYSRGTTQDTAKFNGQFAHSEGTGFGFAVAPRVGYVIPLGESFALWPRLTLGMVRTAARYDSVTAGSYGSGTLQLRGVAELGLIARIHRNVYLRAAPELAVGYTRYLQYPFGSNNGDNRTFITSVGASAGIGILFGG